MKLISNPLSFGDRDRNRQIKMLKMAPIFINADIIINLISATSFSQLIKSRLIVFFLCFSCLLFYSTCVIWGLHLLYIFNLVTMSCHLLTLFQNSFQNYYVCSFLSFITACNRIVIPNSASCRWIAQLKGFVKPNDPKKIRLSKTSFIILYIPLV